jgi:hypothetical protein
MHFNRRRQSLLRPDIMIGARIGKPIPSASAVAVGATNYRADSSSILWIEPFIYNFLCLGNNRFFGTFLEALRDFRAAQMTSREQKSSPSSHFRLG